MTEKILQSEKEIRRFLLGEMSEDERIAFEARFVADENLFEQTCVAEDEMIESYVRGTLSPTDKKNFEKHFLAIDTRRRKVDFTRRMLGNFKNQNESFAVKNAEMVKTNSSVWTSLIEFFKTPKLAFGATFSLLILISGGWFLLRNQKQNEIAGITTPTPTIQTTPIIISNQNPTPTNQPVSNNSNTNATGNIQLNKTSADANVNRKQNNENQNSNPKKVETTSISPVLALFAGSVRGEGKMPELTLSNTTPRVYLLLNLESKDYKTYRAEIVDADGNSILTNNKIKAGNSKLSLAVSPEKLQRGDYIIRLSGVNPDGEMESVADYYFRIKRK